MDTRDLDRIRFVTRHFHALQGLRVWVPAGMVALSAATVAGPAHPALLAAGALLFLGAFLLLLGARRYYSSAFGEVENRPVRAAAPVSSLSIFSPAGSSPLVGSRQEVPIEERLTIIMGLAVAALVLFQLLFWPPWIKLGSEVIFEPHASFGLEPEWAAQAFPSPLLAALCGAFFLAVWQMRERRASQSYHLALGLLLLGLSILPMAAHLWVTLLFCGSALVVAGLLDHRQLVRSMGSPSVEEER